VRLLEASSADLCQELANALQSAQPKIQKMCEEDSEDHEAVAKLFEINDSIHRTIERYKLFKKGDMEGANRIPQGTLGRSGAGVSQGPNNTLNLIDFGDPDPAAPAAAESSAAAQEPAGKGNALEDDLLGLSLGGDSYGQSGSIALGGSNGSGKYFESSLHNLLTLVSPWIVWCASPSVTGPTENLCPTNQRPLCVDSNVNTAANPFTATFIYSLSAHR
jgi:hypothetical protein